MILVDNQALIKSADFSDPHLMNYMKQKSPMTEATCFRARKIRDEIHRASSSPIARDLNRVRKRLTRALVVSESNASVAAFNVDLPDSSALASRARAAQFPLLPWLLLPVITGGANDRRS